MQVANMTEQQFTLLWQDFIDTAATCLLQANDDIESPAGKHLVRHYKETLAKERTVKTVCK